MGDDRPDDADSAEPAGSVRDLPEQAERDPSTGEHAVMSGAAPPQNDLDRVDGDDWDASQTKSETEAETGVVLPPGTTAQIAERRAALRRQLLPPLLVYTLLRFGLTAVLTAVLMLFVPFLIALVLAVILQLPLAMLLFGPQRAKVNALTSELTAERRAERERLRTALRGDGVRLSDD